MKYVYVHNQAELDAALAKRAEDEIIVCRGAGHFTITGSASVRASGSASVRAFGSASVEAFGSASVRASGSASVRAFGSASVEAFDSASVEAFDSASVRAFDSASVRAFGSASVEAFDSASVRASGSASVRAFGSASVEAFDSASVRAFGSASVRAFDSASVRASKYVAVHKMTATAVVRGGVVIESPQIDSPAAWMDYHGVTAKRGIVTLYKAVDAEWHTRGGWTLPDGSVCSYEPGTKPEAADFDPEMRDCGAGLHGCASPGAASIYFNGKPAHHVAVPVRVSEMGTPNPRGDTLKIRFRRAAKPVYEVNASGEPIEA